MQFSNQFITQNLNLNISRGIKIKFYSETITKVQHSIVNYIQTNQQQNYNE